MIIDEGVVRRLIDDGGLWLGMTKAEVRKALGPPEDWGNTSKKYREPNIWKYGEVEFWFEQIHGRTPWPGPPLTGIYTEDVDHHRGRMLLGR